MDDLSKYIRSQTDGGRELADFAEQAANDPSLTASERQAARDKLEEFAKRGILPTSALS